MRGIILAGGTGSRLYPLTKAASKQLLPVYDKPMIYYPLTTLIEAGMSEIGVISNVESLLIYRELLGGGSRFGVTIQYLEQRRPRGIAEAFLIADSFIGRGDVALILGDNIFHGESGLEGLSFSSGALIFAYLVKDPTRYGVVEFDELGEVLSIEEKPVQPKSPWAIPGLYVFDKDVVNIARSLKPSPRGELEITDVIREYLKRGSLTAHKLPRGFVWLDAGTSTSLHQASAYVQTIEERTNIKIGCPEEAALSRALITMDELRESTSKLPQCEYRDYLERLVT